MHLNLNKTEEMILRIDRIRIPEKIKYKYFQSVLYSKGIPSPIWHRERHFIYTDIHFTHSDSYAAISYKYYIHCYYKCYIYKCYYEISASTGGVTAFTLKGRE